MSVNGLIDQVREIAADPRYEKIKNGEYKLIVGFGRTLLKKFVAFNLSDYFNDPQVCLESQLKWKLFWHREIQDDTVITPSVGVDYVTALEPSLFGVQPLISDKTDPTYGQPVIEERSDLNKLQVPDFYKSGLMPRVHEMYNRMRDLAGDRIPVLFPGFARGPWSIACMLRGFTPLYYDLMDAPEFVHRLMNFIVTSRIEWEKERCRFLGIEPGDLNYRWNYCVYRYPASSDQYNDEVDGNLFSVATYREFILPYERKLAEFYGGVDYYHSCGNLTPFLADLVELPNLKMLHVSPHTDLEQAFRLHHPGTVLQVSLHPVNDFMKATAEEMADKIREILSKTEGEPLQIWADAIYEGGDQALVQARQWLEVSRHVIREYHSYA